jgi:hypothetical protein
MKSWSRGGAAFIAVSLPVIPDEHRVSFPPLAKGRKGIDRPRRLSIARNKNTRLPTAAPEVA